MNTQITWAIGVIGYINSVRADSQRDPLVESALRINASEGLNLTFYGLAGNRSGPT
ncbi:MAG: hypothetical protein P0111_12165 [Nitrospira sp.]|nr:hypothetical protein [Nitrospira sp.]